MAPPPPPGWMRLMWPWTALAIPSSRTTTACGGSRVPAVAGQPRGAPDRGEEGPRTRSGPPLRWGGPADHAAHRGSGGERNEERGRDTRITGRSADELVPARAGAGVHADYHVPV